MCPPFFTPLLQMVSAKTVETDRNTSAIRSSPSNLQNQCFRAFLTSALAFLRDDRQPPVSCGSSGWKRSLLEPGLASPFLSHLHLCKVCVKMLHAAIVAFACLFVGTKWGKMGPRGGTGPYSLAVQTEKSSLLKS